MDEATLPGAGRSRPDKSDLGASDLGGSDLSGSDLSGSNFAPSDLAISALSKSVFARAAAIASDMGAAFPVPAASELEAALPGTAGARRSGFFVPPKSGVASLAMAADGVDAAASDPMFPAAEAGAAELSEPLVEPRKGGLGRNGRLAVASGGGGGGRPDAVRCRDI